MLINLQLRHVALVVTMVLIVALAASFPLHIAFADTATPVTGPTEPSPIDSPSGDIVLTNADVFTLLTPLEADGSISLGDFTSTAIHYDYLITTHRSATGLEAVVLDLAGLPTAGWNVAFTTSGEPTLVNTAHTAARERFGFEVVVTRSPDATPTTVQLVLQSTVHLADTSTQPGPTSMLMISSAPVPMQLQAACTFPLTVVGSNLDFGPSQWDGHDYEPLSGMLRITITSPEEDCVLNPTSVVIQGGTPLTSAAGTIANDHLYAEAGAISEPVAWGEVVSEPGTLDQSHTVFVTHVDAAPDGSSTVVDIPITLDPPSSAPPGSYQGSISVTTSASSP